MYKIVKTGDLFNPDGPLKGLVLNIKFLHALWVPRVTGTSFYDETEYTYELLIFWFHNKTTCTCNYYCNTPLKC